MEEGIDLTEIIDSYVSNITNELKVRWNNWNISLVENAIYEVIGGILSRQTSLAIQIAKNISIWNGEIAPILLRSMADNHINLAWVLNNPKEHSEKFIIHGLGQLKLDLEHKRNQHSEENELMEQYIKSEEDFINAHRYSFLTEVNLGSWSGLSTRKMAEEAGIIDFYNNVYQPFSNCSHSTWAHIAKYNLTLSQ